MKRFVFNLETLLRHRENQEEKERNEFSRINYELQSELRRGDDLRGRLKESLREIFRLRCDNTDSGELALYYRYTDRLRNEIRLSDRHVFQLEQALQAQRLVLIEATKKKKLLDSLKAKKHKQYDLIVQRQEQKTVDELVVTRFARRDF
jgi:flagellar protein FliJ